MNGSDIIDAMEGVDGKLLKRAGRRSSLPVPVLAAAALALVLLACVLIWAVYPNKNDGITVMSPPSGSSSVSAEDIDLCYRAALIYKGGYYVSTGVSHEGSDIRGRYIGTSEGLRSGPLNPDTSKDFAASLKGKYYTVKGVDPRYLLCSVNEEGACTIYVCYGLEGLKKGSDVLEDMLHISKGPMTLTFRDLGAHSNGTEGWRILNGEYKSNVEDFIKCLDESRFVPAEFYGSDRLEYNVHIALKNGLSATLFLSGDGKVWLMGINDRAIELGEERLKALTDLLGDPENSRECEAVEHPYID